MVSRCQLNYTAVKRVQQLARREFWPIDFLILHSHHILYSSLRKDPKVQIRHPQFSCAIDSCTMYICCSSSAYLLCRQSGFFLPSGKFGLLVDIPENSKMTGNKLSTKTWTWEWWDQNLKWRTKKACIIALQQQSVSHAIAPYPPLIKRWRFKIIVLHNVIYEYPR